VEEPGGVRPQAQQTESAADRAAVFGPVLRQTGPGRTSPRRARVEGEHPSIRWARICDEEPPRVGYAPSEDQTKRWPIEAQIEGWFLPGEGREQVCFDVVVGVRWSVGLHQDADRKDVNQRAVAAARRPPGCPIQPRCQRGGDAGCQKAELAFGRGKYVLDIPFDRSE
jgi:hypothetical protein